jgi:hypothetical protein
MRRLVLTGCEYRSAVLASGQITRTSTGHRRKFHSAAAYRANCLGLSTTHCLWISTMNPWTGSCFGPRVMTASASKSMDGRSLKFGASRRTGRSLASGSPVMVATRSTASLGSSVNSAFAESCHELGICQTIPAHSRMRSAIAEDVSDETIETLASQGFCTMRLRELVSRVPVCWQAGCCDALPPIPANRNSAHQPARIVGVLSAFDCWLVRRGKGWGGWDLIGAASASTRMCGTRRQRRTLFTL